MVRQPWFVEHRAWAELQLAMVVCRHSQDTREQSSADQSILHCLLR
jgi:hypothetical protein